MLPLISMADEGPLSSKWLSQWANKYQTPSGDQLKHAEDLFYDLFTTQHIDKRKTEWDKLGFEIINTLISDSRILIIQEKADRRQGGGFFIFSLGNSSRTIIQAPHAKSDLYTGNVAIEWFMSGNYLAGAWNTAPRREADMAHTTQSYFAAFSEAFSKAFSDGRIVQLHGFASAKRRTVLAKNADIIISSSRKWPTYEARLMAQCLRNIHNDSVLLYPTEVQELGGTQNTIARLARSYWLDDFIHLELNKSIRNKLSHDSDLRNKFNSCLSEGKR